MARCHRIGQNKEVKVYRLITSNTYEQNVFDCSTRKQGLPKFPSLPILWHWRSCPSIAHVRFTTRDTCISAALTLRKLMGM
jgi:hypothetical protein